MTSYTNALSAEQLIRLIATDYVELSYDKARWQRDYYINICRSWRKARYDELEAAGLLPEPEPPPPLDNDF